MHQLKRVACSPDTASEQQGALDLTVQYNPVPVTIQLKLVGYKCQDHSKGQLPGFDLKVYYILQLCETQKNHCAACDGLMLWSYQPDDIQQFSTDQLDNSKGHCTGNIRLTCLECNRRQGHSTYHPLRGLNRPSEGSSVPSGPSVSFSRMDHMQDLWTGNTEPACRFVIQHHTQNELSTTTQDQWLITGHLQAHHIGRDSEPEHQRESAAPWGQQNTQEQRKKAMSVLT